jgi:DNA transposition AAA+ family ATPase
MGMATRSGPKKTGEPMKKLQHDFKLQDRLCIYLQNKNISPSRFALKAGIDFNLLKQWRREHYLLDNLKSFEAKIKSALDRETNKNTFPNANPIINTTNTKRLYDVCWLCREKRDMGIVVADAGQCKTMGCELFARKYPDTILIKSLPSYSATGLIKKICTCLGLNEGLTLAASFEDCALVLKDSGRLIIVDEGELVSYRGLELIRRLHDFTFCGVVLVGLPVLLQNIRGLRGEFRQLYSRIGVAVKLENITEEDAEALVLHWLPNSPADLWEDFWRVCGANARRLNKLVNMAKHIAEINSCSVDKEIILRACEVLIS